MKNIKYITLIGLFSMLLPSISSCNSSSDNKDTLYLKVFNAGDYVYLNDPDNGYNEPDLVDQYTTWINEPSNKEKYFGKDFDKNIEIIYDTYDTNETMYNELKTGKSTYDLVCSSDYMIQKLASHDLIQKIDKNRIENYTTYASNFLIGEKGKLNKVDISIEDSSKGTLNDYCVGYMWGTMGLMFNPSFSRIKDRTPEQVKEDFINPDGWDTLWTKKDNYYNCASIKDSMRDTYMLGLAHAFRDDFKNLYDTYSDNYNEEYNNKLSDLFNKHDNETIDKVQEALIELKNNIYGFEVDTGKSDIITQKVGINLCWSGDAVYSMDTAEDVGVELYFTIPTYCANIWFDAFTLSKGIDKEHEDASYSFLDFLSLPEIAAENMDYVGYTPFIGGAEVFSTIQSWYDVRQTKDEEFDETLDPGVIDEDYIPYDLTYFFKQNEEDTNSYIVYVAIDQINRQMRAQYPLESDLSHLAIMQDFGASQNDKIVSMWEKVKVNPLPLWVTIIVIASFVFLLTFLGSYKIIKKIKIRRRKAYRNK